MLATFAIEIAFAVFVLIRYSKFVIGRIILVILLALATFQLAEYQICVTGFSDLWARTGYVAITLLPALGMHLVGKCTGTTRGVLGGYIAAAILVTSFSLSVYDIPSATCTGNYLIFHIRSPLHIFFSLYYVGYIAYAMLVLVQHIKNSATATKQRKTLYLIVSMYAAFLVPSAIVLFLYPHTHVAMPSILCGFAVFTAGILTFGVLPSLSKR